VLKVCFPKKALFQSAQHVYEKREGAGSGSITLTNGSKSGSGSPTLLEISSLKIHGSVFFLLSLFAWQKTAGVGAPVPVSGSGSRLIGSADPGPDWQFESRSW
jgi:hypothetical protein